MTGSRNILVILVWLGVVSLFLLYSLRFVIFTLFAKDRIGMAFYTDFTTLMAVGVMIALFTMSSPRSWRIGTMDVLLLLGGGFMVLTIYQRSGVGAVLAFQIFILPFLMRWVRHVPRDTIKAILAVFAIVSSLFVTVEFLILNQGWVDILPINSVITDFYARFGETLNPDSAYITFGGELFRPHGIFGYILTSSVSLAMLTGFFIFESLVYRKLFDYIITFLLITALVLSTSTTAILVVCLPNGFTIRQRSTWPPGLPPLPMGED